MSMQHIQHAMSQSTESFMQSHYLDTKYEMRHTSRLSRRLEICKVRSPSGIRQFISHLSFLLVQRNCIGQWHGGNFRISEP